MKERDSSSWKCKVGSVDPLIRFIAIDPSRYVKREHK